MTKRTLENSERETHISWDDATRVANIFTIDPKSIRKLDKLVAQYPDTYKLEREEDWHGNRACFYKVPAKLIAFRKPVAARTLTEEQRKAAAKRLAQIRQRNS